MLTEKEKISHLYHRAAFGASLKDSRSGLNLQDTIQHILGTAKAVSKLEAVTQEEVEDARRKMASMSKEDKKELKQILKKNVYELNNLWLNEMIRSEAQLTEKMSLFWHGHFACRSTNPYFDQQYLEVIRRNALGNFTTLLEEVSKTPAMLQFLNNQQNKKGHPNENFAREVMELFTLGRGNYSEQDIKEAARAFTGFGFDAAGQFKFRVQQHDFGTKSFLGKSGDFSGEDILRMIVEKKECAYFITKKIYKYFVNDDADETIVSQLADHFFRSGYDIKSLMREIFSSSWFYDEKNIGIKIKSPVELIVGMFRIIPTIFETEESVLFIQRALGQVLFHPPNVAGWSGGRSWIDSSSLLFRMRLPQVLYYDKDLDFSPKDETPEMGMRTMQMADSFVMNKISKKLNAQADWTPALSFFSGSSAPLTEISQTLLARQPDLTALQIIRSNSDNSSPQNKIKSVMIDVLSLPEYQLC